jgi:hypothetical protein
MIDKDPAPLDGLRTTRPGSASGVALSLQNEFAAVRLCLDDTGNGPRLRVVDLRSGKTAFLDPVQLESIVWARREDLVHLADPGRRSWGQTEDGGGAPDPKHMHVPTSSRRA